MQMLPVTYGSNDVDVTVNNSVNRDYLAVKGNFAKIIQSRRVCLY
jgi:hypothetical protein